MRGQYGSCKSSNTETMTSVNNVLSILNRHNLAKRKHYYIAFLASPVINGSVCVRVYTVCVCILPDSPRILPDSPSACVQPWFVNPGLDYNLLKITVFTHNNLEEIYISSALKIVPAKISVNCVRKSRKNTHA